MTRSALLSIATIAALIGLSPLSAQGVRQLDPNIAYSAAKASTAPSKPKLNVEPQNKSPATEDINADLAPKDISPSAQPPTGSPAQAVPAASQPLSEGATYKRDDLIGAAEGVFGKGAAGLAGVIEKILKEQGQPNAYIAGREVSGAFIVGLRYGSGTLRHKIEGDRTAYWTGPSLGFDAGGDATKTFVLVYNLYDSQDLYKRFGQIEGRAYFIGGFSVTYLRKNNVVLIPVRLGVGVRLGANFGYMKFSEKSQWFPF
jgi:hypothetical protein